MSGTGQGDPTELIGTGLGEGCGDCTEDGVKPCAAGCADRVYRPVPGIERATAAAAQALREPIETGGTDLNTAVAAAVLRAGGPIIAEATRQQLAGPDRAVKTPVGAGYAEAFRINYAHGPEFGWECIPCRVEHLNVGTAGQAERLAALHNAAEHAGNHLSAAAAFSIMGEVGAAVAGAKQRGAPPADTHDCRSPEGETVGLIDGAIVMLRLVSRADLSSRPVREALADLLSDPEVAAVLREGGGGQAPASR